MRNTRHTIASDSDEDTTRNTTDAESTRPKQLSDSTDTRDGANNECKKIVHLRLTEN